MSRVSRLVSYELHKSSSVDRFTYFRQTLCQGGWNSVTGIAAGYGLGGPNTESRWRARFPAYIQTGPGNHPASCKMDTVSISRGLRGQNVTLIIHSHLAPRLKKEYSYTCTPALDLQGERLLFYPLVSLQITRKAKIVIIGLTFCHYKN